MNYDVILNVNQYTNFVLISIKSKKKNKTYYALAIEIKGQPFVLKFLTNKQVDVILENKKGE